MLHFDVHVEIRVTGARVLIPAVVRNQTGTSGAEAASPQTVCIQARICSDGADAKERCRQIAGAAVACGIPAVAIKLEGTAIGRRRYRLPRQLPMQLAETLAFASPLIAASSAV